MNLFEEGIIPVWEHSKNKGGKVFQMEYQIKEGLNDFLFEIEKAWANMVLKTIGESIIGSDFVSYYYFYLD